MRELRGREIAKRGGIRQIGSRYAVPSQSKAAVSTYFVDLVEESCTCPDYELRRQPCKHVHATYYFIAWGRDVAADGSVTETLTVKRKTYQRDWSAYNSAQTNEGLYVERLLRALCDGIDEPARKPGPGRKPVPLKDATFAAAMKVYGAKSQRRAVSDLADSVEKGNLDRVAHFNTISNFLADENTTALLVSLIEESAKPLAALENGQFAIDSTGFSTVTYDRWFDQKHGKLMAEHAWIKLHVAVGTVTHAITGVKVTPEADCPQLPSLLSQTMKNFMVRELSADKAYSSKKNLEALESFGVEPFIPFKINAKVDPKCEVWSRHLAEFLFNQDKFLPHYHRRSNVESVMWMLKSKFGAAVRSKTPIAQINEVLCKCLCHNLACLVQAIFTAGLAPRFWQDAAPKVPARPTLTLVR
jgi:transposase